MMGRFIKWLFKQETPAFKIYAKQCLERSIVKQYQDTKGDFYE